MKLLVTGGAGFIGSAFIRHVMASTSDQVVNVDKLTYAGHLGTLEECVASDRYRFEQIDIVDGAQVARVFAEHRPDAVVHLAAESHVDRSIDAPSAFIQTNIVGTYTLLEHALRYWTSLEGSQRAAFRFLHVSTDEVYGSLGPTGKFVETTRYDPNSPYSASKAASDHLVRAWHRTYGLPIVLTNCSNNYGPYQFPEKLIPLLILNALEGRPLPLYGKGDQVRDWLFVEDHVRALLLVLTRGAAGETYNIGGHGERMNLDVARTVCGLLDELAPAHPAGVRQYSDLITFVADRPGHDRRYAIDSTKIQRDLGWTPRQSFESGMRRTVEWYLTHADWCRDIQSGHYRRERLGLAAAP